MRPRAALEDSRAKAGGILANSMANRVLLALRGGECSLTQLRERFGSLGYAMSLLTAAGYAEQSQLDRKSEKYRITEAGRALVAPGGPLSRQATEIVYCQL